MNYINIHLKGLLANQMFCVSALFAYAWKHNLTPIVKSNQISRNHDKGRESLLKVFPNIPFNDEVDFEIEEFLEEPKSLGFRYQEIPFYPNKNVQMRGFRQSEKYFVEYKKEIQKMFEPTLDEKKYLEDKYSDILNNSVSLHIRKGRDNADTYSSAYYCLFEDLNTYYPNAIRKILQMDTKIDNIVIFSDAVDWVEENLDLDEFDANVTFVRGEKDYMDIHLMSMCEQNVIANSTFSWWGAWLNRNKEKVVIAPTEWHPLHKKRKFSDQDIICENWIRVEVK